MAGTISLSLSQQFDADGRPLSGGLLYFYQSGTTTPQSAYQDSGLTIAHPNPIELDASGRVPSFFLANGNIKIRLTDSTGQTVLVADGLLVIGASSGTGGSVAVDPTTVLDTGDIKGRYGTGTLSGFVRCNGRTIGSATSGGTERANADCQDLFVYLWNSVADSVLAVSGGRGGSANSDWSANKNIQLPDMRGRFLAGMDDMGASAAGRLTSDGLGSGISGTALGSAGGDQVSLLVEANIPIHSHSTTVSLSGTTGNQSQGHTHSLSVSGSATTSSDGAHTHTIGENATGVGGTAVASGSLSASAGFTETTSSDGAHTHSVSMTSTGTSGAQSQSHTHSFSASGAFTSSNVGGTNNFSNTPPTMVITMYMKL